jgi:hypothetical protein
MKEYNSQMKDKNDFGENYDRVVNNRYTVNFWRVLRKGAGVSRNHRFLRQGI